VKREAETVHVMDKDADGNTGATCGTAGVSDRMGTGVDIGVKCGA
jgi:hypothetical protein